VTTTDLQLEAPGSLPKPGPVGRLVRAVFGVMCLWYVLRLVESSSSLFSAENHINPIVWNGLIVGLFLISYVVNIGFSRPWKKWPALASGGLFITLAGIGYLMTGSMETEFLARAIWGWEIYLFFHLGAAFIISALIGTPGCEMRALHDLYSRLTGISTREHYCPIGPLHPIDQWESSRKK
jgi:hypothetical protein